MKNKINFTEEETNKNSYPYKTTFRINVGKNIYQQCIICKKWKSINDFAVWKKETLTPDMEPKTNFVRNIKCNKCQSKYFKEWYKKKKEQKDNKIETEESKNINDLTKDIYDDYKKKIKKIIHKKKNKKSKNSKKTKQKRIIGWNMLIHS